MSIIITAGYYLWAIQRVLFNKETEELTNTTPAQWWEIYPVLALAFFSILLGLVPGIFWTVLDFFTESILP
jgi:NADH:ubiquinone oxidoreductase subunit 4 (subunit M)